MLASEVISQYASGVPEGKRRSQCRSHADSHLGDSIRLAFDADVFRTVENDDVPRMEKEGVLPNHQGERTSLVFRKFDEPDGLFVGVGNERACRGLPYPESSSAPSSCGVSIRLRPARVARARDVGIRVDGLPLYRARNNRILPHGQTQGGVRRKLLLLSPDEVLVTLLIFIKKRSIRIRRVVKGESCVVVDEVLRRIDSGLGVGGGYDLSGTD